MSEQCGCAEVDEDFLLSLRSAALATRATRAVVRGGGVVPHAQRFADIVQERTRVSSFGTYHGHHPDISRAIDIFVPINPPDQGDAVAKLALENWGRYGLMYIIWRQRINSNDGRGWRPMADRGNPTQNHFDHLHASFWPEPEPEEEDFMATLSEEEKRRAIEMWTQTSHLIEKLFTGLVRPLGDGDEDKGLRVMADVFRTVHEMAQEE